METDNPEPHPVERRYIRHPARMPIGFALQGNAPPRDEHLRNVSAGGLCFSAAVSLGPGQSIRLTIPLFDQQYQLDAVVAWCRPAAGGFEVGVRFLEPQDRFCIRMVEQLCYIEDYRLQVEREQGRQLTSEQAAKEWIERFADQFPGLH
jgi:hypothetical protein